MTQKSVNHFFPDELLKQSFKTEQYLIAYNSSCIALVIQESLFSQLKSTIDDFLSKLDLDIHVEVQQLRYYGCQHLFAILTPKETATTPTVKGNAERLNVLLSLMSESTATEE